ncbi:MAG: PHP domain-containing protein [Methanomicrobiales archaeon]|nr:PHP domain-containing protein [Methanomicrobiales archaeon]
MLKCDLHVHSNFSRDGESSIDEILQRAEEAGLDAIAITDHDTMEGYRLASSANSRVLVIPGIEVSTRHGHIIVLGIDRPLPPRRDVRETIVEAQVMGGLVILPHPYHMWRHGVARKVRGILRMVDAVEAFNSRYIVGTANRKAAQMAQRYRKPCVGGSDAHNARFVGFGVTYIQAEPTVQSILQAIREGHTIAGCRMTPLRTYTRQSLRSVLWKVRRRVRL